jgi:CBS domain-containing protein
MQEFADFLAKQPPFNALSTTDIERLASKIDVEYFVKETVIVAAGSPALDHLYIVRTGSVEVLDKGNIVDLLGPGDAFGHISLLTGLSPQYSVRAAEDSLCYRLPDPRTIVQDATALNFNHFGTLITRHRLTANALMSDTQSRVTRFMRELVWVDQSTSIRQVAKAMNAAEQSCALIQGHGQRQALGIVSDRDFRSRIGSGEINIDARVSTIMSSPVITVSHHFTLATAFLTMVEVGVHHLVVVDDDEKPIGVVRAMDLASVELRNPLMIRSAIDSATSIQELASAASMLFPTLIELHDSGIPALHIGALQSAIVGAILFRVIQLSPLLAGPVEHSWLILGSMARGEPLPISDVDTAIVWADLQSDLDPADEIRRNAKAILELMEKCGLHRCAEGANADNGLFSRSRSSWIKVSSNWLTDPSLAGALLLSAMAADSQPLTQVVLGRTITETIRSTTRSRNFLYQSLRFAIAKKPPIGFVRDFVVQDNGENRDKLDLKSGGLTPISSLARWSAIVQLL